MLAGAVPATDGVRGDGLLPRQHLRGVACLTRGRLGAALLTTTLCLVALVLLMNFVLLSLLLPLAFSLPVCLIEPALLLTLALLLAIVVVLLALLLSLAFPLTVRVVLLALLLPLALALTVAVIALTKLTKVFCVGGSQLLVGLPLLPAPLQLGLALLLSSPLTEPALALGGPSAVGCSWRSCTRHARKPPRT